MSIKGTILVIDDTHANLVMLTDLLKTEGYEVHPVDSGELAHASVAANPPDLILLNIHLPGMDGLEVLRRLKTQPESQNIPVIFQCAVTDRDEQVEALKLGAVDFITKPIQRDESLARIQTHIELGKMRSRLKKTEINLEEERILLRTLIDNLPDVIYVKDTKGRRILSNIAGWQANGGKSMEDVIGKTDFDTYPRELAEKFWAIDKEVMESGIPIINHEEPGIDSDGNPTWVLTTKMPLRDNLGKIVGLMGIGHNITRRKQMEEELLNSESSLQTILNSTADGILAVDINNEVLYTNTRFAELWHIPQTIMTSKDDGIFLHYVVDQLCDPNVFLEKIHNLYKSKEESLDTLNFKDGRVFERLSRPLLQGHEVRGRVWSFRDITESKQAEMKLMESKALFQSFVENASDIIFTISPEGNFTYVTPNWTEKLGHDTSEIIGHSIEFFVHPDDQEAWRELLDKTLKTGMDNIGFKYQILNKDGKWRLHTVHTSAIRDNNGKFVSLLGIAHDITERSQASQALRENEAKMSAIADSAHDAILMLDPKGRISYWNKAAESIFGYSNAEAMGQKLHDFIVPQRYHEAHHAAFPAFVKTGQGSDVGKTHEVGGLRKDGSEIPIQLSLSSFQMNNEWYAVGIISDISERKNNELLQNVIYRITQAAITSGGIDALYQSIHAILGELLPTENFFIALYDPAKKMISFPYYIDQYDEKPLTPIHLQGLTGYVIRTGCSLLANREIYDQLVQKGEVEEVGTASEDWLGVPLKTNGRIIGVMAVQSYTEGIHFLQKDVDLLEFVSTQVSQVIERKRLEEEILSLSLTDELTGLYNRRGFMVLAEQEVKLSHRKKKNMLLFFGDVDGLKTINDTQGHAQGDLALKEVATILKTIFREADIIARIGGDEFVALALDASPEGEKILADRIQSAFEVRNKKGDIKFNLSISLGIVCYDPASPVTVSKLIARADELMYEQKLAK